MQTLYTSTVRVISCQIPVALTQGRRLCHTSAILSFTQMSALPSAVVIVICMLYSIKESQLYPSTSEVMHVCISVKPFCQCLRQLAQYYAGDPMLHSAGTGRPRVLNPANFLPDVRAQSFTPAQEASTRQVPRARCQACRSSSLVVERLIMALPLKRASLAENCHHHICCVSANNTSDIALQGACDRYAGPMQALLSNTLQSAASFVDSIIVQCRQSDKRYSCLQPTWVNTKQADVLSHIVLEDERFYLKATSGLFPGELSSANILRRLLPSVVYGPGTAPQSRNWIGGNLYPSWDVAHY